MQAAEIARVFAAPLQLPLDFGESDIGRRAFRAGRRFPALVLGPVDFWALRSLAASRSGLKGGLEIPSWISMSYSMTSLILLSIFFFRGYGVAAAIASTRLGLPCASQW